MSKKYYYTDAIVALYMMKEFGVKYDFENEESLIRIIKTPENRRDNFMRKIYVGKESEHIFESKEGDLAHYDLNGGSGVYQFTNKPIRWAEGVTNIQIIRRDNKQFLMPEVEND